MLNPGNNPSARSPSQSSKRPADDHATPTRHVRNTEKCSITLTPRKRAKITVNDAAGEGGASPGRDTSPIPAGKMLFKAAAEAYNNTSDSDHGTEDEAGSSMVVSNGNAQESDTAEEGSDNHEDAPYKNRAVRQVKKSKHETLAAHPTNPDLVIAAFSYRHPDGRGLMTQFNTMPEIPLLLTGDDKLSQEIWPDPSRCKVPSRIRSKKGVDGARWVRDNAKDCWVRTSVDLGGKRETVEFRVQVVFRRFHPGTHVYLAMYSNVEKLKDADPNNKPWMYGYNKWIDQLNRRTNTAYTAQVPRDHWSAKELRALLTGINAYCYSKGIDQFGCKDAPMKNPDFQVIADAINIVGDKGRRNVDAVRSQINTAHAKKMSCLMDLRVLAAKMRNRIKDGETLADSERRPLHAMPLSEFPQDPPPTAEKTKGRSKEKGKGKAKAAPIQRPFKDSSSVSNSDSNQSPSSSKQAISRKRKSSVALSNSSDESSATEPEDAFPPGPFKQARAASPAKKQTRYCEKTLAQAEAALSDSEESESPTGDQDTQKSEATAKDRDKT